MVKDIYGNLSMKYLDLADEELSECRKCLEEFTRHLERAKSLTKEAETVLIEPESMNTREAVKTAIKDSGKLYQRYAEETGRSLSTIRTCIYAIKDRVTVYKVARLCEYFHMQLCVVSSIGKVYPLKYVPPEKHGEFDIRRFRKQMGIDSDDPSVWFTTRFDN